MNPNFDVDAIKIVCVSCNNNLSVESTLNHQSAVFVCGDCGMQVNVRMVKR